MYMKIRGYIGQSNFLRMNAVFFVGSLAVAFLNYLYYPIVGRLLPTVAFGEVQTLISLYMQVTIFMTVLTLVSLNVVVNETNKDTANRILTELEKLALYIGTALLVLVAVLAVPLSQAFKFDSPWPFVVMALVFMIGIPSAFGMAYLRGKQDFVGTSIAGVVGSTAKIVFAVVLVMAGMQTLGAVTGLLLAQLVMLGYIAWKARKLGFARTVGDGWKLDSVVLRPYLPYGLFVLCLSLITTLLFSVDVVVVKYLFSPEVAGQYAGIATVARIIFFLTASISAVLMSSVGIHKPMHDNWRVLLRSLAMTAAIGGVATIIFGLFPVQIIHILMGDRYDAYASLLPPLSLALFVISLANLLAAYNMALRSYYSAVAAIIGLAATGGALLAWHDTPRQVVYSFLFGSVVMFAAFMLWTFVGRRSK